MEEIRIFDDTLKRYDIDPNKGVVFIMCREPQEIKKFVEMNNAITVCVRRKEAEEKEPSNHADAEVFNFNYHFQIDNNYDLDYLRIAAKQFLTLI